MSEVQSYSDAPTIRGECLCGAVGFELRGALPKLYQCHCSLCRRVSGSSSNAALIVSSAQFGWLHGGERISEYSTDDGFKSHFCNRCGSPLPNPTAENTAYWVPAGLLEDCDFLELAAHFHVASRARWDRIADVGEHFDDMPRGERLAQLLQAPKTGSGRQP